MKELNDKLSALNGAVNRIRRIKNLLKALGEVKAGTRGQGEGGVRQD